MYVYDQFGFGNYGVATAASYVLFVAIAALTFVLFRALRPTE
jgi:multiple sugar transport system permease protein